uniref:Transmembrane protein n=1 Tax=Globodera pallida TaxID=36090 RepID=A0A183CEY0_GLOPA
MATTMGDTINQPIPSFMTNLPVNDQQKVALQFAFYNTLLFSLLGICLASIFAVYRMLYLFLMPILWALLVGTVLFPLKRMISDSLKSWLNRLDKENRPLLVGVAFLPVQSILQISFCVYEIMLSSTGFCIFFAYAALKILCDYGAFSSLFVWIGRIYGLADTFIGISTQNWVFVLIFLYSMGFGGWIYLHELGQINKKFARVLSLPIWLFLLAYLSAFFGFLRVFTFIFCCSLLVLISVGAIDANTETEDGDQIETEDGDQTEAGDGDQQHRASAADNETEMEVDTAGETRLDQAFSSDVHLRIIVGLCVLLLVVRYNLLLFALIIIPLSIALVVQIGERIGLFAFISQQLMDFKKQIVQRASKFVHVIVVGPLRKFVRLLFTSDRMFVCGFRDRVDLLASLSVMCILAVGCLSALLFTVFHLHSETLHLAKLGSNVLSSNPDWLRDVLNYTGDHLKEKDIDSYMEQAYQQGRTWLAGNIRQLADPKDPARADRLEEQAKLLVDNLYQLWEERGQHIIDESFQGDLTGSEATHKRRRSVLKIDGENAIVDGSDEYDAAGDGHEDGRRAWVAGLVRNANMAMWRAELTAMVTQNIETVWTIAHSLWHIVLMNIALLFTILLAALSLLVEFSFDLFNFLIEWLVFLTTLYYLLANSKKPSNKGVFVLSAKMAIFYGLYTYFVHSIFSLNVVIMPSILAALLAAIPIFPPYSVALFGIVELYLVRGEPIVALLFVGASVAPLFFADPVFYRELKGSHPYVTGLAVIGGIYWLGLQGAIIGPIILCLMVALLNVYSQFAGDRTLRS